MESGIRLPMQLGVVEVNASFINDFFKHTANIIGNTKSFINHLQIRFKTIPVHILHAEIKTVEDNFKAIESRYKSLFMRSVPIFYYDDDRGRMNLFPLPDYFIRTHNDFGNAFLAYALSKNFNLHLSAFPDEIAKKNAKVTKIQAEGGIIDPHIELTTFKDFATAVFDADLVKDKLQPILYPQDRSPSIITNIYFVDTENLCMRTLSYAAQAGLPRKDKNNVYRSLFSIVYNNAQANPNNMFIFINHHDYIIPADRLHPEINHSDIFTNVLPNFYIFNKKCVGTCETDDFSLMLSFRFVDAAIFQKFVMSHDNYSWYTKPIPKAIFDSAPAGDRHIIHNANQGDIEAFYQRLF